MDYIHKTREDYSNQFGVSDAFIPGMEYAEIKTAPINYKSKMFRAIQKFYRKIKWFFKNNEEPIHNTMDSSSYLNTSLFETPGEITQARLIAESLWFEPFDTLDSKLECEKDITVKLVVES